MPSLLSRLFGRRGEAASPPSPLPPPPPSSESGLIPEMQRRALPAIAIEHGTRAGGSKIGGLPDLPAAFPWPRWRGAPLAFLAQLDCAAMRAAGGPDWLPGSGTLFFFYHAELETWGFDPEDRGSWAVIHDPQGGAARPVAPPEDLAPPHAELPVGFRPIRSLPDPGRLRPFGFTAMDDAEWDDAYEMMLHAFGAGERHQVGGFPAPIQADSMERECQLASNGIYVGNAEGYKHPEAAALAPGATEWRLLLQLDSDDSAGMMWGDCGRLYFWIRESDALAGNFDAVWMVLQCG